MKLSKWCRQFCLSMKKNGYFYTGTVKALKIFFDIYIPENALFIKNVEVFILLVYYSN